MWSGADGEGKSFSLFKGHLSHHRDPTLPNYLPKALSLNTMLLGVRVSKLEFGEGHNC